VQTILFPIISSYHFSNKYYITFGYSSFISTYITFKHSEMSTCNQKPKKRGVQEAGRCGTGLTAGE
jgi:hypothetical protein